MRNKNFFIRLLTILFITQLFYVSGLQAKTIDVNIPAQTHERKWGTINIPTQRISLEDDDDEDDYKFKKLGETLDDAIGEAYAKVASDVGLLYPGGPNIEKLAKEGVHTYSLPIPVNDNTYNFSYSGLKSAVINLVHNETQRKKEIRKEDLAKSFQDAAIDELVRKVE